jgi:aspartyl-tRNA(Asn)/glutamyl-tRNA(Gln) amidotransferase subunit C
MTPLDNATQETEQLILALYQQKLMSRERLQEYLNQVQQIDTTGVSPTASVVTSNQADRTDQVRPSLDRAEALANAPDADTEGRLFRVPRVIG